MTLPATPKNLLGLSALFLVSAFAFAVLNTYKIKALRISATDAVALSNMAEQRHAGQEKELKAREAKLAASAKAGERDNGAASVEADFIKLQNDKADLQTKLHANEAQIAELQRRLDEATAKPSANPGAPSTIELQAQLDDARAQLDAAEREKTFLSEKLRTDQERSGRLEEDKKRRAGSGIAGVRGAVLAVNQAYNFVVLNLGGRNGVESNAEMLVVRAGTLIGKIRISSVEPSTAIGDIITSSLARGVQVQPGDTVIYGGGP